VIDGADVIAVIEGADLIELIDLIDRSRPRRTPEDGPT
jgi:hypothetical protein